MDMSALSEALGTIAKENGRKGVKLADLAEAMTKTGARHGKRDRDLLQKAHDAVSSMADCAHCTMDKAAKEEMEKRGARHAAVDMDRIKKAHDALVECGAMCPSPNKDGKMTADDEADLQKYNDSHDEGGRFSSDGSAGGGKEHGANAHEAVTDSNAHHKMALKHEQSAEQHKDMAAEANSRGNDAKWEYHREQASNHEQLAEKHAQIANQLRGLSRSYTRTSERYGSGAGNKSRGGSQPALLNTKHPGTDYDY